MFDDLVPPEDYELLQGWEQETSYINRKRPKKERPLQYGRAFETLAVFEKCNWHQSRFTDGTRYGLWYGALEEETSIREALYHSFRFHRNMLVHRVSITVDRKMFAAQCESTETKDLRPMVSMYKSLMDPDDYAFCQRVGQKADEQNVELLVYSSVRRTEGTCVAAIDPKVIKNERFLKFLHFTFFRGSATVVVTTDEDQSFEIPDEWLQNN